MATPLGTRRTSYSTSRLIRLRMDILRQRRASLVRQAIRWLTLEQSQASFDMNIVWIEFSGS